MKLKQLSVFLENAPGRLYEVLQALAAVGLNLKALCISDTSAFGVLRILVSDLPKARGVIMEMRLPARVDEVLAAEIDDSPGSLAKVLKPFKETQVNVEYLYALSGPGAAPGKAVMIFRFSDNDRAVEIMQQNGITLLDTRAIGMLENV
jgi:hypothetical protein